MLLYTFFFFFSSRRRHTRLQGDWSSDVCSSDLMTVAQRVQFAMKGGSEARRTLIRDNNKVVQRAVLQSPRLTDQEVEAFAAMSSLTDEILRLIAGNRNRSEERRVGKECRSRWSPD